MFCSLPGPGSQSGACAVEGDVGRVGGEASQDPIWIAIRECVDLNRVVRRRSNQLVVL